MQAVRLTSTFSQVQHFLDSPLDLQCLIYSLVNIVTRTHPNDFNIGAFCLVIVLQWTSARLVGFETGSDNVFLVIRPLNHGANPTHFTNPVLRRRFELNVISRATVFTYTAPCEATEQ